jgi:plasmid maintenance system antidote protein VapI
MNKYIAKYKGIHHGIILDREFKKRSLRQRPFALSIDEHPQTLNAITKGRRDISISIALKIEEKLGLEEGTLAILQTYYNIQKERQNLKSTGPDLTLLRNSLFWDTDINKIQWNKQATAVIRRVFDRGNESEKNEITRFYGRKKIGSAMNSRQRKPYSISSS